MADEARKPKLEIVDDPISVAKPDGFDLDRFKSKRAAATANVETLQAPCRTHRSRRRKTSSGCTRTKTTIGRPNCAS